MPKESMYKHNAKKQISDMTLDLCLKYKGLGILGDRILTHVMALQAVSLGHVVGIRLR
jgi:hypothetical protein